MGCFEVYTRSGFERSRESLHSIGVTSVKPKLGRGRGGAHGYHTYFRHAGYSAACYMTAQMFVDFVAYCKQSDLQIDANVLGIKDPRDNVYEARNYHMFFRTDADAFVFKSYLSGAPDKLKIRTGTAIVEPYLYSFHR